MRLMTRGDRRPLPRPRGNPAEIIDRLEQTADGHDEDARHEKTPETRRLVHRMVAADLRQAAIDVAAVQ